MEHRPQRSRNGHEGWTARYDPTDDGPESADGPHASALIGKPVLSAACPDERRRPNATEGVRGRPSKFPIHLGISTSAPLLTRGMLWEHAPNYVRRS